MANAGSVEVVLTARTEEFQRNMHRAGSTFDELKKQFGRRSELGEFFETLKGAGLVGGITLAAKEMAEMVKGAAELARDMQDANKAGEDFAKRLIESIPIIGTVAKSIDDMIGALVGGENASGNKAAGEKFKSFFELAEKAKRARFDAIGTPVEKLERDRDEQIDAINEAHFRATAGKRAAAVIGLEQKRAKAEADIRETFAQRIFNFEMDLAAKLFDARDEHQRRMEEKLLAEDAFRDRLAAREKARIRAAAEANIALMRERAAFAENVAAKFDEFKNARKSFAERVLGRLDAVSPQTAISGERGSSATLALTGRRGGSDNTLTGIKKAIDAQLKEDREHNRKLQQIIDKLPPEWRIGELN